MVHFEGDPDADDGDDVFGDVDGLDEIKNRFVFPDGLYEMRIIDVERNTAKSSGKPKLEWAIALTGMGCGKLGGPLVDMSDKVEPGTELKAHTSLSPQALFKVKQAAEALQLPIEGGKIKAKKTDVLNRRFIGSTETRKYTRDDGTEGESSGLKNWYPHPDGAVE